jgi:16S rRNA processing protein RimM
VEKQQWGNDNSKIITFKNSSEQLVEQSIGKNVFLPLSTLPKLSEINFIITKSLGMKSEKKMVNLAEIL